MHLKRITSFLVGNELWFVAPAAALGMFIPAWLPFSLGLVMIFWPLRWLVYRRFTVRTVADIPVLLLLVMVPVTLWASPFPGKTTIQVLRLLLGIGLFYSLANWTTSRTRLRWVYLGLVLVLLALSLVAPFGVQWLTTKYPLIPVGTLSGLPTLLADTANPNVMAGTLVILLPLVLGPLLFSWKRMPLWELVLLLAVGVISTIVLVLTQSRGAWLAFLAAVGVLFMLRWRWSVLLFLFAAVALGLVVFLDDSRTLLNELVGGGELVSLEGRLEVWSRAIYLVEDFSITGAGMGSYMPVVDLLYPFFLFSPGTIEHAHNLFLQLAVDLGIPGLVAWLAVLGGVVAGTVNAYTRSRLASDPAGSGITAGLLGCLVALVVHGLTDAVTWGMVRPAPLVWVTWGFAAACAILFMAPGEALE